MQDYLKWNLYTKFQRSRLKRLRVISERSFVSTWSFAGKTWIACCKNPCFVFEYNSPKSMMLTDVDRSVNGALFYVKDETVLDLWRDKIKLLSLLKTTSFAISSLVNEEISTEMNEHFPNCFEPHFESEAKCKVRTNRKLR